MKSKKAFIISSACLLVLVSAVVIVFAVWYNNETKLTIDTMLPDETVVATVNDEKIKIVQVRYYQIIKLAYLSKIGDNNRESLDDQADTEEIIDRLSVYLEINRKQNDNFFLVYKEINYSESEVKSAVDDAIKKFKEKCSKEDYFELYEYIDLLQNEQESQRMNNLMMLQMVYQKFRLEYFKYYRQQSFSEAELETIFHKHILDIRGKNEIKILSLD